MIEVRLFATFRDGRGKKCELCADTFSTVDEILSELKIQSTEVAICLINGFHHSTDTAIHDGDIISLFPPVGGG